MNISVELTAIICMATGSIFWLSGLSYGVNQNKKDIAALAVKQEKDTTTASAKHEDLGGKFAAIWKELSDISKSLARIEGRNERGLEEPR